MGKTGRPKKTDSRVLVQLVEDYFANEGHGDPQSLQCTKLAIYAEKCGVQAHDYDFRRDDKVKERIAELKQMHPPGSKPVGMTAYRNFDIEGMIRSCGDLPTLRRKLYELDGYWRDVYSSAEDTRREASQLHKDRERMTKEKEDLRKELEEEQEGKARVMAENKRLAAENAFLRKQLRTYLYPALANELLIQANLPGTKSSDIRPEAVSTMIEGSTPLPFDGVRGSFPAKRTRAEELEEQMKAQVYNGD